MNEPTKQQKALYDEIAYLRGRVLMAYAQIEFLFADLSVKLDLHFPYPVSERIKAAKRIADRPGFEVYRDELTKVCDDLLEFEELRHLMAHGFVRLMTDRKGAHMFDFLLYQRDNKDEFHLLQVFVDIPRMQYNVDSITSYVTRAVALFKRIYLEKGIEKPPE